MQIANIEIMPSGLQVLPPHRRQRLNELLHYLENNESVRGVLLGGSLSYREDTRKSDADLFCLIQQVDRFEHSISNASLKLKDVDVIIFQGYFPWTEKLYTVYYKQDIDFCVDVCMVDIKNANTFFWEPDGCILWDKDGMIARCRKKQMSSPAYTRQPFLKPNAFSLAVVTLKKIEKNLSRGHLWNSLEQLSILRRYIMQIIRLNLLKDAIFLGRVDRDIEEVIPHELNERLAKTIPRYDCVDIALKTIMLVQIIESLMNCFDESRENNLKEWVEKQLQYERERLNRYLQECTSRNS